MGHRFYASLVWYLSRASRHMTTLPSKKTNKKLSLSVVAVLCFLPAWSHNTATGCNLCTPLFFHVFLLRCMFIFILYIYIYITDIMHISHVYYNSTATFLKRLSHILYDLQRKKRWNERSRSISRHKRGRLQHVLTTDRSVALPKVSITRAAEHKTSVCVCVLYV